MAICSWYRAGWLLGLALCAGAGCRTPQAPLPQRLPDRQLKAFFAQAADPRRYWITVYPGEDRPVFANACRLHPGGPVPLPFVGPHESTAPVVRLAVSSFAHADALCDPTARESWMGFAAARTLEAIPLGPPGYDARPAHVMEPLEGYLSIVPRLLFEDAQMESALFYVRPATGPLGLLSRGLGGRTPPQAVAGLDLLQAFAYVQFDCAGRCLLVSSTQPYEPDETKLVATVPLRESKEGVFLVDGLILGRPESFLLDLAGDFACAMATVPPEGRLRRVTLGDLALQNLPVVAARDQGLGLLAYPRIGRQALAALKVTFEWKKRLVHFERR